MTEDEHAECAYCGETTGDLSWGPDPYLAEIHDDVEPMWLCRPCYDDRNMDI